MFESSIGLEVISHVTSCTSKLQFFLLITEKLEPYDDDDKRKSVEVIYIFVFESSIGLEVIRHVTHDKLYMVSIITSIQYFH